MQSIYSVYGTAIHLLLDDEFVRTYDRAIDAIEEAASRLEKVFGKDYPTDEPISIGWNDDEMKAYNDFADLINKMIEINGGSLALSEADVTTQRLLKV